MHDVSILRNLLGPCARLLQTLLLLLHVWLLTGAALAAVVIFADAVLGERAVHGDAIVLRAAAAHVVDLPLALVHILKAMLLQAGLERARELLAGVLLVHLSHAR